MDASTESPALISKPTTAHTSLYVASPQSSPVLLNNQSPISSSHAHSPSPEPSSNRPIQASRLRDNMLRSGAAAFSALQEAAEKIKESASPSAPPAQPALTTYQYSFVNFMSGALSALPEEKQQIFINKTMEFYLDLSK